MDKNKNVLYRKDFTLDDVNKINSFSEACEAGLIWKFIDHMYIYQTVNKVDWYEGQINSGVGKEGIKYAVGEMTKTKLIGLNLR